MKKKKIRMNNPEDTFMKRQFTYLGEIAHEFYNLPGEYIGSECNEYPNVDGGIPRADIVYSIEIEGKRYIINIEDETSNVNENTLKKSYNYKINIYYKTKEPVISVITTTLPLEKCQKELWISITELFKPIIISLPNEKAWKRLNTMINKAKNKKEFSNIEGLELINLPRFCLKNQDHAIELICKELPKLKIKDEYVKNELIYSMQCMIHKYAKTDKNIIELEEMIGLRQTMKKRSPVLDNMERQGILKGIKIGRKEGKDEGIKEGIKEGKDTTLKCLDKLANDPTNNLTAEDLAKIFGYTPDEIKNANKN